MLPTKFRFIWESGFRGEIFLEINQSETRTVVSEEKIFKNGPIRNKNCLVSEEKIFLNRPIRYKNCLWFQRRTFKKIGQSEKRIACGGHVC